MCDLIKRKEIEQALTLSSEDNTSLVTPIEQSELEVYRENGQLVELNNTVAVGLCKVIEKLPEIAARKGMSKLYKLDMKGINGTLMTLKSGGNTTAIVDEAGKIVGQGSITAVGTTGAQVLANVMNVASVATGMYYMNEITNQLQHTERLLSGVKQILEDEKKAEIIAIFGELNKIYNDYQFCITENGYNEPLLTASRQMLTSNEQKLNAYIEFYLLQLNHDYDKFNKKDKTKVVDETIQDFCVHTILLKQLFDLFCVKTVLEINYSDKSTLNNDAFIESRKELLLSKYNMINDELNKMVEVKKYISNERYGLIDSFKAMQLDDALIAAGKDISAWRIPIRYQYPAKVVVNAFENYKDTRKSNVETKSTEIENNIGGFRIESPTQYTEMIDNLVMLGESCPDLILDGDKVYLIQNQ